MTLANRITILRIVLVPVFATLIMVYSRTEDWTRLVALAVFVVAAISDGLDGFIARAFDQKTTLGAVLDPFADRLMLNTGFIVLALNSQLPLHLPGWFPVLVLTRDCVVVSGALWLHRFRGPLKVRPRLSGKLTTACQMTLIVVVLLQWTWTPELLQATAGLTLLSLLDYLYVGTRYAKRKES